ncbi:hypothetical protein AVEN_249758-1 [Araneus ventricosus]|uniref:Methyltransferase-like protein 7A n=1 Tax=Araneus ventricosus TaxID=182803 RepID=A0A4Y2C5Q0_ARAVE|nr:hypothetical protein AVEN_249758-1 [Araneus ventricosus]
MNVSYINNRATERLSTVTSRIQCSGLKRAVCLLFAHGLALALLFILSFRSLFFAWANSNIFEPFVRAGFDVARKKAFRMLQDELNPGSQFLEVLETGVGHGPNLRFYLESYNHTALDKKENMKPYFLKNLKRFTHIPYTGGL